MTLAEILAAVEALPMAEHQQALVKINTAYNRRLKAYRKASAEVERDCEHTWMGTDTVGGEHYRRCAKCGAEKTYLSDD